MGTFWLLCALSFIYHAASVDNICCCARRGERATTHNGIPHQFPLTPL